MKLSQTKELYICSIKRLYLELDENLKDKKTIAVLLSMEEAEHLKLKPLDAYLKVEVFDTELEDKPFSFNFGEALKIKEFLDEKNDFERLYVCCDSGESRSTAVAAAVMRYYGKNDKEIWINPHYHPNMLVYREQCRAFGKRAPKLKLRYLKRINDKALRRKINSNR